MTKRRAKRHFILLAIVVAVIGILTFVSFPIPFSIGGVNYKFESFISQISLGHDLGGGVTAIFSTEVDQGDDDLHGEYVGNALAGLEDLLINEGYSNVVVTRQNDTDIRIELGGLDDARELENLIGEPGLLRFATSTTPDETTFMTGKNVTKVEGMQAYTSSGYTWGVQITFDSEGKQLFADKTANLAENSGYLYIYLGNTQISSAQISEAITGGSTFITSPDLTNKKSTNQLAFKINLGTYMLKFKCETCEVDTPILGTKATTKLLISLAIIFVAVMLGMWLMFGDFGLLADLSLIIYIVLDIFMLQAIPGLLLTGTALVGVMLTFALAIGINVAYFNRIKAELNNGKTFAGSIKLAWKKIVANTLDVSAIAMILGIFLAIFGTPALQQFAFTFMLGIGLALLTSFLYTRRLMSLYLPFNYDNPKRAKMPVVTKPSEVADEK